jgi:hypothetical protein
MVKAFSVVVILALAGCSGVASYRPSASACLAGEATYDCQVERYLNVRAK